MESGKFKFVSAGKKTCNVLEKKSHLEFLMKWSMKGHLKVKYYNFNEAFQLHDKQEFVDSFFTNPAVTSTLETVQSNAWLPIGSSAVKVVCEHIPCTVTSMAFFTKLEDPKNDIVSNGLILQCMDDMINGFYISNHLQQMLLDVEHPTYTLFSKNEREQFIFCIFKHLILGGKWCQHEDNIHPYLDLTRDLYKSLISVERFENQANLFVRSIVLKCVAYSEGEVPLCPNNPDHIQNFIYLVIDPFKRQVAALYHQYCDLFIT